jgi:hypothetical protein
VYGCEAVERSEKRREEKRREEKDQLVGRIIDMASPEEKRREEKRREEKRREEKKLSPKQNLDCH